MNTLLRTCALPSDSWSERRPSPLALGSQQRGVEIAGYTPAPDEQMSIDYNVVSADYFTAMGISVVRGRGFEAQDDSAGPGAIVVNARFA